jgi:hypothetical protein
MPPSSAAPTGSAFSHKSFWQKVKRSNAGTCSLLRCDHEVEEHLVNALPTNNLDYAWDRAETAESLRTKLAGGPSPEWLRTAAWLMREARTDEVWQFLTLRQVADSFSQLRPMLGRRRQLWEYLLRAAHELGRL